MTDNTETTQARKKCWSCEEVTYYNMGWCLECMRFINRDTFMVDLFYASRVERTEFGDEILRGQLRTALADFVRRKRLPKSNIIYQPRLPEEGLLELD